MADTHEDDVEVFAISEFSERMDEWHIATYRMPMHSGRCTCGDMPQEEFNPRSEVILLPPTPTPVSRPEDASPALDLPEPNISPEPRILEPRMFESRGFEPQILESPVFEPWRFELLSSEEMAGSSATMSPEQRRELSEIYQQVIAEYNAASSAPTFTPGDVPSWLLGVESTDETVDLTLSTQESTAVAVGSVTNRSGTIVSPITFDNAAPTTAAATPSTTAATTIAVVAAGARTPPAPARAASAAPKKVKRRALDRYEVLQALKQAQEHGISLPGTPPRPGRIGRPNRSEDAWVTAAAQNGLVNLAQAPRRFGRPTSEESQQRRRDQAILDAWATAHPEHQL